MYKLLLLVCIGVLLKADIATAHFFTIYSCKVPLTVLSGNIECRLTDLESSTFECKIVKFSYITYTFSEEDSVRFIDFDTPSYKNSVPTESHVKLAMTSVCIESDQCRQAFDCESGAATDDDGCHLNGLTADYHCH